MCKREVHLTKSTGQFVLGKSDTFEVSKYILVTVRPYTLTSSQSLGAACTSKVDGKFVPRSELTNLWHAAFTAVPFFF